MVDPSPRLITINELRAAISGRPSVKVQRGRVFLITRRGHPVAALIPPQVVEDHPSWLAADIICHGDAVCECPTALSASSQMVSGVRWDSRGNRPYGRRLQVDGGMADVADEKKPRIPARVSVFSKHQGNRRQGADGVQDPW
jgi:antitoxin (DNA-binding transcriptional repressor) of toxin-antitoxin stability system